MKKAASLQKEDQIITKITLLMTERRQANQKIDDLQEGIMRAEKQIENYKLLIQNLRNEFKIEENELEEVTREKYKWIYQVIAKTQLKKDVK